MQIYEIYEIKFYIIGKLNIFNKILKPKISYQKKDMEAKENKLIVNQEEHGSPK